MNVKEARQEIERRKGRCEQAKTQLSRIDNKIKALQQSYDTIKEAQMILQTVAQATQQELEYHISELVTLASQAVFPDPYRLNLDFELKRGKSEAVLSFSKGDDKEKLDPFAATGGGAVDVACFGLRVSLWSLQRDRSRPTFILDEPFRFVSRDLQVRASEMIKEVSERLKIQFIIITHEPNLLESADQVFEVRNKKRVSIVKMEE